MGNSLVSDTVCITGTLQGGTRTNCHTARRVLLPFEGVEMKMKKQVVIEQLTLCQNNLFFDKTTCYMKSVENIYSIK